MLVIGAACSSGRGHKLTAAGHTSSSTVDSATTVDQATSTAGAVTQSPTTAMTRGAAAPKAGPTPTTARASAAPPNNNDSGGTVTVTEANSGQTFTLHRNQNLSVSLSGDNVWSEPQPSNAQVLTRSSGSTNSDGGAQATFAATGDGQSTVSADGRPHPCANPPCATPDHVVAFQVTVNVVG